MNRKFADSFFLIVLLSQRDRCHRRAVEIIDSLDCGLLTSEWVLAEAADAMSNPGARSKFLSLYELLRNHPLVSIVPANHDHFEQGLRLYASRPDKEWPLTDCVSFVIMRECGVNEALTGDHHYEQAGFKALLAEGRE